MSNPGEALSRHTWVLFLCRAHSHAVPNDLTPSPRSQVNRTHRAISFQSSACELVDSQSLYQQYLGTSLECLQPASERARERVVPPTSFLHILQCAENSHPIDAGSTVTCLVHGQGLVDSLKPALVPKTDPPKTPVFGGHSSCGSCDHDRRGGTNSFYLHARSSNGRVYVTSKRTSNAAIWG